MRILADLHWKLPRPLTAAEQRLRDVTLPGLQASVAKLRLALEVHISYSVATNYVDWGPDTHCTAGCAEHGTCVCNTNVVL